MNDPIDIVLFNKSVESSTKFIKWYLDIAKVIATKSKDKSTQVGCVIVSNNNILLSVGYNGFVRGFHSDDDDKYHERPLKYNYTIHAEENAIASAAQIGVSLRCSTIFCTHPPCCECTKLLINSGIYHMIFPAEQDEEFLNRSKHSFDIAKEMCKRTAYRLAFTKDNELIWSPW